MFATALVAMRCNSVRPATRALLDAHNAYPEAGRWADRIDRALSTGTPLAIEQDLYWRRDSLTGSYEIVVAHDADRIYGAPTLESYFFERIRPLMERALADNRREDWPLVILNLDFKTNEPALHDAVWALLGKYEPWLTTAPRTSTPDTPSTLSIGPLLVLTGSDSGQRVRFHDLVPVGKRLRAFGAVPVPAPVGATRAAQAAAMIAADPSTLMAARAANYVRWVNFPWSVVELGGATSAGEWSVADSARLDALVHRAHHQGYFIRFYTLDGYPKEEDRGLTASYNFGSQSAVNERWRATILAGVDFVATDQYEAFVAFRKSLAYGDTGRALPPR